MRRPGLLLTLLGMGASACGLESAPSPPSAIAPTSPAVLEHMRALGDLEAQRAHVWHVFQSVTRQGGPGHRPVFLDWYGAGEVFSSSTATADPAMRGLVQAFSAPDRQQRSSAASGLPPLIVRAHYSPAAFTHIRLNDLQQANRLAALGDVPAALQGETHSIPAFPRDAMVIKSVWWPVPAHGVVALPVWDPESNPARASGNGYLTWSRVVGVSADEGFDGTAATVNVDFLGRSFRNVHAVGVDDLFQIALDQPMADALMKDPESWKVAGMVLGRPVRAGDRLVLVALHLATREVSDWVWGTFWWHDRPDDARHAPPPHPDAPAPWHHYRMAVAFDTELPHETDGSPHIAFNPWLEGRFPDSGHGSGVVSNCMSCHRRASTALDQPFLVTRGHENIQTPGRSGNAVTTSLLWSLPMQAR